jgi:hypothetical protein
MDMISGNRTLDDFHVLGLAQLSYKVPEPLRYLSVEHLLTVFRDPYHIVLEVIDCVRSLTVILHTVMLLKSSPKGEGFSPRGRH